MPKLNYSPKFKSKIDDNDVRTILICLQKKIYLLKKCDLLEY